MFMTGRPSRISIQRQRQCSMGVKHIPSICARTKGKRINFALFCSSWLSSPFQINSAEGNGKYTAPDRCRFFDIARDSA
jgi:hypothetical protein